MVMGSARCALAQGGKEPERPLPSDNSERVASGNMPRAIDGLTCTALGLAYHAK